MLCIDGTNAMNNYDTQRDVPLKKITRACYHEGDGYCPYCVAHTFNIYCNSVVICVENKIMLAVYLM